MVLIDDIAPHCGGFTVWPGSHRRLQPHYATVFGNKRHPEKEEALAEARNEAIRDTTPVEFAGEAGDVVFWHPRLIHSPGINRSAEFGKPAMRYVIPCDYQRDGLSFYEPEWGPSWERQWWVDTRNFREDLPVTPDNMWDPWAFEQS